MLKKQFLTKKNSATPQLCRLKTGFIEQISHAYQILPRRSQGTHLTILQNMEIRQIIYRQ